MKFKTPYNQRDVVSKGEVNTLPSKTIPDQTMTIKEMLIRHASGLPFQGAKVPIFEGTDSPFKGKDPKTFDMSELAEMRDEAIEREKNRLTKLKERQKQDREAKYLSDVKKAAQQLKTPPKEEKNEGEQPS